MSDNWMNDYDDYMGWADGSGKKSDSVTDLGSWKGKAKPKKSWKRCWEENHKPIELGNGTVLGAACAHPHDGYDIYVGFDHGMKFAHSPYPWEQKDDPAIEFLYPITDMCAPKSPKEFKKMISWLAEQLDAGKKIHMGCIGGHGRTGTVLAALYKVVTGDKDAIKWVRENHCKKGVESTSQVNFLNKHFGIKKMSPTKGGGSSGGSHKGQKQLFDGKGTQHQADLDKNCQIKAVQSSGTIW